MELYQIRYFLALCETLNFARAAERCSVCQPSMTRAIQKLEEELGGVLIRRERRLTHLTELGQLIRPILAEVLSHVEHTKSAADRFLSGTRKRAKLGVMRSIGPARLAPLLARLTAENRDLELTVIDAEAGRLNELLLGGSLDVAIAAPLEPRGERLRLYSLYDERLVVAFPAGHRFERRDAVPLRELKDEDVVLRSHCELTARMLDSCRQQGFEPNVVHSSEREDWVQMMVAAGRGVTAMPEDAHFGNLTLSRPLVEPEIRRDVSLVNVAGRPLDPRVQLLMRAIRAHRWGDAPTARAQSCAPLPAPLPERALAPPELH